MSDKKIGVSANGTTIDYYTADVVSATDNYVFGMTMPGRSYQSDKYRYGFNGKEKDKDIGIDNYDFGARVYDGRIGRWFSTDNIDIVGWNTYHFVLNNPIQYKDVNGNIQKDPNGNIIFTPIRWNPLLLKADENYVRLMIFQNEETRYKKAVVEIGYIYTDKGTPVKSYRIIGYYEDGYSFVKNKNGETTQARFQEFVPVKNDPGIKSNCYGDCVAQGKFYIPDTEGLETFLSDEYKEIKNGNISKNTKFQTGDVLKLGEEHFIKAVGTDKKGNTLWSSDFGLDEPIVNTINGVIKQLTDTYGKTEGQVFSLKKAKLWRRQGNDNIRPDGTPIRNPTNVQHPSSKPKDEYEVKPTQEKAEAAAKKSTN